MVSRIARGWARFGSRCVRPGEPGARPAALAGVPPEEKGSMLFGIVTHLLPSTVFIALAQATHFSLAAIAPSLVVASLLGLTLILWAEKRSPCVALPSSSPREVCAGMTLVFVTGVGIGSAVVAGISWPLSAVSPLPWRTSGWLPVLVTVPLTDLGYCWAHRVLSHGKGMHPLVRWYRQHHARHHSVSALDFFRGNISSVFDTAMGGFQVSLAVVAVLLGMDLASTLVAYVLVLLLQGTHHANHTFDIGPLRYLLVDNHVHKLHHCPRGNLVNHGAVVSVWDRLFGTFYENWSLSASYMERHRIALPLVPAAEARAARPVSCPRARGTIPDGIGRRGGLVSRRPS